MPFPVDVRPSAYTYDRYPQWADVYWYDFGAVRSKQDHTMADPHPCVVVSNTGYTRRGAVLVIALSGAEHQVPNYLPHVLVTKQEYPRLDKDSIAKTDQVFCVPVHMGLPDQYYLTTLTRQTMRRIYEQLLRVLNFDQFLRAPRST